MLFQNRTDLRFISTPILLSGEINNASSCLWSVYELSLFCVQPTRGDPPRDGNLRRQLADFLTCSPASLCFCGQLPGAK